MTGVPRVEAVQGRLWRLYADARTRLAGRGSSEAALDALGSPDRQDPTEWNRLLADRHEAYRDRCPPVAGSAAVVCVSRRPHLLDDVIANVRRQHDVDVEFTLVTNEAGFDHIEVEAALAGFERARHVTMDPESTLGTCLNRALELTDERFVAKFDDDDHYGARHLVDSLRAHGYAGAGVVGKHTYYAAIEETGDRHLRFPCNEFRYSSTLAGGTLVIDRRRTGDLRFDDISIGEDRAFIAACHRRGVSTFSADRFNFLQHRGSDNTWSIESDEFLVGTVPVTDEDEIHVVDR